MTEQNQLETHGAAIPSRPPRRADSIGIIGRSHSITDMRRKIQRAAASTATVLLLGETGSGKGLAARSIHNDSARAFGPFVAVDCGAIPLGLFESELFGHERGAFTGAIATRRGLCEAAVGGTLFLDEIGELPLTLQPKLLRVLQERTFMRVGGSVALAMDTRVIAATNKDLSKMVERGQFREDLLYRLRVVEIAVPPLRARRGDLEQIVQAILPRICDRNERPIPTLTSDAWARLRGYGWPGNVRELENILERAVVFCDGVTVSSDHIPLAGLEWRGAVTRQLPAAGDVSPLGSRTGSHRTVMESFERDRLVEAQRQFGGNQSNAARALGIPRTTYINKLRRHGIV